MYIYRLEKNKHVDVLSLNTRQQLTDQKFSRLQFDCAANQKKKILRVKKANLWFSVQLRSVGPLEIRRADTLWLQSEF